MPIPACPNLESEKRPRLIPNPHLILHIAQNQRIFTLNRQFLNVVAQKNNTFL
jgi:hypothetical protein